jgi:uroporphyrinogen decarboxylase
MKKMTHRQRLQAALDHQEPDRVPIDFGTGGNTSPVPEAYKKLAASLKVDYRLQLVPHMMRLAVVDERILRALDIDTRPIYMHPAPGSIQPCSEPGYFYDEWGVKWREYQANEIIYREVAESPLEHASIEDLDEYAWWPDPFDPARYPGLQEQAEYMYTQTDYALIGCPAFNSVWERSYLLCGFTRMLESLLLDPDFVHAVFRKITTIVKASLDQYLSRVGAYIQVVKIGDDLGGQHNPLISPTTYRKTIKPYHQEIFQFIKQRTAGRIFLHSCGSVYQLLPELIDCGVEILNPVQVSAKDMDTRRLKAEFGESISFWGAIDTQHVLPYGSMKEVQDEVRQRLSDLGPGGGYVVAPVHNVQADVPAENVIAMYQSARESGRYPLQ